MPYLTFPRPVFPYLLLLPLVALPACTVGRGTGNDVGSSTADSGAPTHCSGDTSRCSGADFQRCVGSQWTTEATCNGTTEVCDPTAGCITPTPCQRAALDRSSMGCEYFAVDLPQPRVTSWPLVLGHPWSAPWGVAISNPNAEPTDVRITQNDAAPGAGVSETVVMEATIPADSVQLFPLPTREVSGLASNMGPPSHSGVTNNAYRITTTLPTVAYQFNPLANQDIFSDDASLLVPVHSLDESYLAIGWPGRGADGPASIPADNRSFLTIVAVEPNTHVRVTPSTAVQPGGDVPALAAGDSYEVALDQYGVLNVQGADVAVAGPTDFTGSLVVADHPVAVFSGVEAINISPPGDNSCCADHLEEQLLPRSALGGEYAVVRSAVRRPASVGTPEEDYFKILAIDDGTTVTTSLAGADASFTLGRGEARLLYTAESFTVSATHPVVVAQFLVSGEAIHPPVVDPFTHETTDDGEQIGDPSFITIAPVAQFRDEYRFLVPAGYAHGYALVAAPVGVTLTIDGIAASCAHASLGDLSGTTWEALHCALGEGGHHLVASAPVGVVVEGWGAGVVSYGYTAGMDFEPINTDCSNDSDCPGGEFCSGGYCAPLINVF